MPFESAQAFCGRVLESFVRLRSAYGFSLDECEELEAGRYIAVLRSSSFALRVLYDRGGIETAVGAPSAAASCLAAEGSMRIWFSADRVIRFMKNDTTVDLAESLARMDEIQKLSTIDYLQNWDARLDSDFTSLTEFFSQAHSKETLEAYEAFCETLRPGIRRQNEDTANK